MTLPHPSYDDSIVQELLVWLQAVAEKGTALKQSSKHIMTDDIFVACVGAQSDGRNFIADAITKGAKAIIYEAIDVPASIEALLSSTKTPSYGISNLKSKLALIAASWYDFPSKKLTVIGITGTNGKTSTTQWIAKILNSGGSKCAILGTLGAFYPDGEKVDTGLTTPDALTVQYFLYQLVCQAVPYVAIEVSSIGIEQGRLDYVSIGIAACTNITQDHLDYHQSMENYIAAKARLFRWEGVYALIANLDCTHTKALFEASKHTQPQVEHLGYSVQYPKQESTDVETHAKDICATDLIGSHMGMVFNLHMQEGVVQVSTHLVGAHNVSNLLLVAGVLQVLGWSQKRIAGGLSRALPVAGRLEPVQMKAGIPFVVIDYAHTEDALLRALEAMRPIAQARQGKLWVVFGCGGQRDSLKRPAMGKVAVAMADQVVVTSDNPRNEDPQKIIADILEGMNASSSVTVSAERAKAILHAVMYADPADVILIAGKGHENYQEIAGQRLPFSDMIQAKLALRQYPTVEKSADLMRLSDAAIFMQGIIACAQEYSGLGFTNVSTDTRTIEAGDLFFALSGENFDGHRFVVQAYEKGAIAAVVSHPIADLSSFPQIVVRDPQVALSKLACAWRRNFPIPVIGIVGSNGKTTTKEMLANVCKVHYGADQVLATEGNLNNHIGVSLTLMRLRKTHKVAVIEMGMNHPGEMQELTAIVQPSIVTMTNAQREHQEFMETVEAVAIENGQAIEGLPIDGVAIYPQQSPYDSIWQQQSAGRQQRTFGFNETTDFYAVDRYLASTGSQFQLFEKSTGHTSSIILGIPGEHNIHNALAVFATATSLQISRTSIVQGLETFIAVSGRMQMHNLPSGKLLIDDTYNANPDSVRAAITVLAQQEAPRLLILGDMGEVGSEVVEAHAEVGVFAKEKGIETLWAVGEKVQAAANAFGEGAFFFASMEELITHLKASVTVDVRAILVKGSRFMRMERVVMCIKEVVS